ncbi:uncharacterized protein LOC110834084 isoform X2 [Zootermopsis nevadensis]|uniref:uncharacterized protein LOC110834084 isoform X2 n=1 Tax=Zootermopsis nevadensis TaxID=136037 RepID=UPI000B8E2D8B|nr:uncharacterized protein LOC110834084 isoform X2 [Zootermopsis nevadensis]
MADSTKPFSLLEPEVIITVKEEQEDRGISEDTANQIENDELIVDMKVSISGVVNEVKVGNMQLGLEPFSVNRYQDYDMGSLEYMNPWNS